MKHKILSPDGTELHVRLACREDLPALRGLVESAYRGESARGGWTHEADLLGGQRSDEAMLADLIEDPDSALPAAWSGAAPMACVHVSRVGSSASLGLLAVRPDLQGTGLGRQMMEVGEAHARKVFGAETMRMSVIRQRTELIAYYERRGYRLTAETAPFPYGDDRFGQPRRDDLEFVIMEKELS